MNDDNYLNEEEQFKEILNNEEISRIEDNELRNIRLKYWNLYRELFLAENEVPDSVLEMRTQKLKLAEKEELENYKKNYKKL